VGAIPVERIENPPKNYYFSPGFCTMLFSLNLRVKLLFFDLGAAIIESSPESPERDIRNHDQV
jgi:hypothetical protein